jgi:DNA-binding LytR/AlgR family response regulator
MNEINHHIKHKAWHLQDLKAEAKKYRYRRDFYFGSQAAYAYALKYNLLDSICAHMTAKPRGKPVKTVFSHEYSGVESVEYQGCMLCRRLDSPSKTLARYVCYVWLHAVTVIESADKKTFVSTADGGIYMTGASLANILAAVPGVFIQASRDCLVRHGAVANLDKREQSLVLKNGSLVKLSRRQFAELSKLKF